MEHPEKHAILAGKYRLIRQLGKGGMGSVWYTEHLTLQSPVAIKLMDPRIAANPEALTRFLREARAAAALRSPHVVQILDHGVDEGTPYIAMEVLEGETLADRLERVGALSPAETSWIITHVSRALSKAHEAGIIHRDLKPDNIFLVRNDEEEIAKVLDFGIAKSTPSGLAMSTSGQTNSGMLVGTPCYMSPEQAEGDPLDHRSDVWALGVIAFECLVGGRPFDAVTIGSVFLAICSRPMPIPSRLGNVPPGFDEWFARACARDCEQRFQSAKAAAADLRRVCEAAPNAAQPGFVPAEPNSEDVALGPEVRKSGRGVLGVLGLVVAVSAVAFWTLSTRDPPRTQTLVTSSASVPAPPTAVPPAQSAALVPHPSSSSTADVMAASSQTPAPAPTRSTRRAPAKRLDPAPAGKPKVNFGF